MATFKSIEKKPIEYTVRFNTIMDGKKIWDVVSKGVDVLLGIAAKDEAEALSLVVPDKKFAEVTKHKMNFCWEVWRNSEFIATGKSNTEEEAFEYSKLTMQAKDLLVIFDNKNSNKGIAEYTLNSKGAFKKLVIKDTYLHNWRSSGI